MYSNRNTYQGEFANGQAMAAGYLSLLVMEMLGLPIAMRGNILEMNLMDRAQSGVVLPPSIIPLIIS